MQFNRNDGTWGSRVRRHTLSPADRIRYRRNRAVARSWGTRIGRRLAYRHLRRRVVGRGRYASNIPVNVVDRISQFVG